MGKANAQIAQHGGVGQVALPAGDRQLAGQVLHDRVGDAQVAFGVFEVDRVDLVRHGRGADFTRNGLLFEVAEGDIGPDIAIKVDQNGIEARDGIEQLGDVVVRLDLGGVRVELQAQGLLDELLGVGLPVQFGVGGQVGVVVANGTVDLAQQFHGGELVALALQAGDHIGHFLAHGGGGGGLAMGARQHGLVGLGVGLAADGADHLVHLRQQDFPGFFQHQGVGQVIDVLTGAGEVNKLAHAGQLFVLGHLFLDEVFHRFHIVIGGGFDFLDALGVFGFKVAGDAAQVPGSLAAHQRYFRDVLVVGELFQPAHFHMHAEADKAVFTGGVAQGIHLAGIAAIDR